MKRFIAAVLAASVMTTSVFASEITVVLDGSQVEFSSQEPVIENGRTLIPLRGVFEKLGYEISWDAETKTAEFKNSENVICITAGADSFTINGGSVDLDVPAGIINGSMMLPLRAVGEAAGISVDWNSSTKTVTLSSDKEAGEVSAEYLSELNDYLENEAISQSFYELLMLYSNYNRALGEGLAFAGSVPELSAYLALYIELCRNMKTAVGSLPSNDVSGKTAEAVNSFFDKTIEYYQYYYDFYNSGEEISEAEANEKLAALGAEADSLSEEASDAVSNMGREEFGSTYYNMTYNSPPYYNELTDEEKAETDAYRTEIGSAVNSVLKSSFLTEEAVRSEASYSEAAESIRSALNSVYTPTGCTLIKYEMLAACGLLETAGEAVKNGALEGTGTDAEFIKYTAALNSAENLFKRSLESYFNTDSMQKEEIEAITV